jgi:DEAD/DEAH box helicase domain-containing protein
MIREVIFDLETKKIFEEIDANDPAKLGVSVVSLYQRTLDDSFNEISGKIQSFWEKDFASMWQIFQEAQRIIGFNSIKFDVPALSPYANFPFARLKHFDILDKVKEVFGRRISLDKIAKDTIGRQKTGSGLNAVYYWNKGDKESLEKLKKYCEQDVLLTKEIYDFGVKNKELRFTDKWNTPRIIEIDFSYPQEEDDNQIGLF